MSMVSSRIGRLYRTLSYWYEVTVGYDFDVITNLVLGAMLGFFVGEEMLVAVLRGVERLPGNIGDIHIGLILAVVVSLVIGAQVGQAIGGLISLKRTCSGVRISLVGPDGERSKHLFSLRWPIYLLIGVQVGILLNSLVYHDVRELYLWCYLLCVLLYLLATLIAKRFQAKYDN